MTVSTPPLTTPDALVRLFSTADAPTADLRIALAETWATTEHPLLTLPRQRWTEMFRSVGYFSHGGRALTPARVSAPTAPVRLYRGAVDGWERGLAWSPSPIAARSYGFPLWTCLAPPSSVLAILLFGLVAPDDPFYAEYIVDLPADIAVEEVQIQSGGSVTFAFGGRSRKATLRDAHRFLSDADLADLRPSALGWTFGGFTPDGRGSVKFFGPGEVLAVVASRHQAWLGSAPNSREF